MVTCRLPVGQPEKGENGEGKGQHGFIVAEKRKYHEFRKGETIGWRREDESNPDL